jgi:hypothetical protein
MYMLFNIDTDKRNKSLLKEEIFSKQYQRFLELRNGKNTNSKDKQLIMTALARLFTGLSESDDDKIYLTMRREGDTPQSVQMIYGVVHARDVNEMDPNVKTNFLRF